MGTNKLLEVPCWRGLVNRDHLQVDYLPQQSPSRLDFLGLSLPMEKGLI